MAEGQKYNAFSGVFTPSLLTILGVIMYMRLGWVVGEAGLIAALGIIVLAHVISITTGLSISSIATDKKIKTGGIYYILSRSLGMPMGGAIGIALFIGTALSISLYIVGFAESFLAIDAIREFTGIVADKSGFRIVGTFVIIILVIIAFISTSLAMRMQFFILIAIALSLISIAFGFFQGGGITTNHISFTPNGDIPLELIFAVFFPAVTGFTAGVAMSGDLKDPKKDIPRGTIFAIGIGFIIYVTLAIAMAYFIPKEDLIGNYNILSKIAWLAPLVIAGIWGATLSSALGGILGGPRIIQAIAKDKMSPKIFAKGYGESHEPRNALLLIFAIAEGGILIGELDVIAGVVSMFYLASYGFINLAYVLEKWSSSDFRPTFKIHIAFGIVGFIASFAVMFKLDMGSMIASLLIMAGLYTVLKRREIRSENGDVWQSVLGTIIRKTLAKIQGRTIEERNWKPNIILFSGATNKRPHLLSFGKSLIGSYGLLSNFDLHEKKDENVLFTKYEQAIIEKDSQDMGVFTRQQSCNNIYEGIETIAQIYGFAGVEPNTILMGWARQAKDPTRFGQMLTRISTLDYNVLLLDYDKINGFGDKKQIDIWWRGSGRHGNLSLTLVKFLSNSLDWNQANIRLLIVNYENHKMEMIRKRAEEYLENSRIEAELIIINNEIEQKPFYDIMKSESQKSDLVFLGIPEITKGKELEFVQSTNSLMHDIGSVVLVKASATFKDLHLGISNEAYESEQIQVINKTQQANIEISWPQNNAVAHELRQFHYKITKNFDTYLDSLYQQITKDNEQLLNKIEEDYLQTIKNIEGLGGKFDKTRQVQLVNRHRSNLLIRINKTLEQYSSAKLNEQGHVFESSLPLFIQESNSYFAQLPKQIHIKYSKEDFLALECRSKTQKRYKWWKKTFSGEQIKYKLQYKKLVSEKVLVHYESFLLGHFKHFGLMHVQFIIELLKISKTIDNSFISLSDKFQKNNINNSTFSEQSETIANEFAKLKLLNQEIAINLNQEFYTHVAEQCNLLSSIFNQLHPNSVLIPDDEDKPHIKSLKLIINKIPSAWRKNQQLIYNASTTEVRLLSLKSKIKTIIYKLSQDIKNQIDTEVIETYQNYLEETENKETPTIDISSISINNSISNLFDESFRALNRTFSSFPEHIKIYEADKLNEFEDQQFSNIEHSEISAKQLIDYLIKNKIEAPLLKNQEQLNHNISESIAKLNESKRLISFAFKQPNLEELNDDIDLENPLIEGKTKITKELHLLKESIQNIELEADSLFNEISQLLSYYSFIKTASNLKQYIHQQKKLSHFDIFKSKIRSWSRYIKEQQANLIYAQSKALLQRNKMEQTSLQKNPVKLLLDLTYQLTPDLSILANLPFYYKQMFSSKNILHRDFWIGREKEIEAVKSSVERYFSGHKGAIAIVGESGSGKSFFSYYISTLVKVPKVLSINPLFDLSPTLDDLTSAFQKASEKEKSIENILQGLPKDTLILFDNLELWWPSNNPNHPIINYILDLISKYQNQFIFVINTQEISFNQIITNTTRSDLFLDIVKLNNVDSRSLKNIVLTRHKTSGLKLKMNKQLFSELSETKLAVLFNKIHKITNGNIEASLHLWLGAIHNFDKETIEIKLPKISLQSLESLDIDSRVLLKQFAIHKRLNIETLAKLVYSKPNEIESKLLFLIRSGLLVKHKNHYQQNTYTKYYTNHFLIKKGML